MISMPPLTLATLAVGVRRAVAIAGVVLPLLGAVQRRIVLVVAVVAVIEAEPLRLAFLRPAPGGRRIGAVAEDAAIVLGVLVVSLCGDAVPRRGSDQGHVQRPEERRAGRECVSTRRPQGAPWHKKKNK